MIFSKGNKRPVTIFTVVEVYTTSGHHCPSSYICERILLLLLFYNDPLIDKIHLSCLPVSIQAALTQKPEEAETHNFAILNINME